MTAFATDPLHFQTPLPLRHPGEDVSRNHYWSYHKLPTLLACKRPLTESQDEDLFIAVHQVCEIAFHQMVIDLDRTLDALREALQDDPRKGDPAIGDLGEAVYFLTRVNRLWRTVNTTMPILADMRAFGQFRTSIGPTSGFQSFQFRRIEIQSGVRERYWQGGTANAEGQLHVAETEFDRVYGPEVQAWLEAYGHHNLAHYWERLRSRQYRDTAPPPSSSRPATGAERDDIVRFTAALRDLDRAQTAFHKSHLQLAVVQLRRVGAEVGTGGTSFKDYLARYETEVAPLFDGLGEAGGA